MEIKYMKFMYFELRIYKSIDTWIIFAVMYATLAVHS